MATEPTREGETGRATAQLDWHPARTPRPARLVRPPLSIHGLSGRAGAQDASRTCDSSSRSGAQLLQSSAHRRDVRFVTRARHGTQRSHACGATGGAEAPAEQPAQEEQPECTAGGQAGSFVTDAICEYWSSMGVATGTAAEQSRRAGDVLIVHVRCVTNDFKTSLIEIDHCSRAMTNVQQQAVPVASTRKLN